MTQEIELMSKLLKFYKGRYTGIEMESKFNSAVEDLIDLVFVLNKCNCCIRNRRY